MLNSMLNLRKSNRDYTFHMDNQERFYKLFNSHYYANDCGQPYQRDDYWLAFFDKIAQRIVEDIQPRTVFDAGCAMGFLIECLRNRGVEAWGVDISPYAIEQVHPDIRPYCQVGSLVDPLPEVLPKEYDLVVSIEVLEHLPEDEGKRAVGGLCNLTKDVLCSASYQNFREATHLNVQPPDFWAQQFARHGFYRDIDFDASFITPWTMRFRKGIEPLHQVVRDYERHLWRIQAELQELRSSNLEKMEKIQKISQQLEPNPVPKIQPGDALTAADTDKQQPERKGNRLAKAARFISKYGLKALPGRLYSELLLRLGKAPAAAAAPITPQAPEPPAPALLTVQDLFRDRFTHMTPLRVFSTPGMPERRLNMVTDSINSGSLFGGVGTAMILSTLLARRWDADLRIITRIQNSDKRNYEQVLAPNHIPFPKKVEFVFADRMDPTSEVPVADGDVFLTTSWWTTRGVRQNIHPSKIFYLIQEDERSFFPYGDDHLLCTEMMQDPDIHFIVNSRMLADFLAVEGFSNIRQNGVWFEPAWPQETFYAEDRDINLKRNFFFYARPNNVRNLFYRGIEVIEKAVVKGILNPAEWDFHFAGRDIPNLQINGFSPQHYENLTWAEYAALVRKMDLGLCLMYTPHPSYPPLDLAASGAIAVTNRFGSKQNLDQYSENILCRDIGVDSLVQGLEAGVALARNRELRRKHYENNHISRDWNASFEPVLQTFEKGPFNVHP